MGLFYPILSNLSPVLHPDSPCHPGRTLEEASQLCPRKTCSDLLPRLNSSSEPRASPLAMVVAAGHDVSGVWYRARVVYPAVCRVYQGSVGRRCTPGRVAHPGYTILCRSTFWTRSWTCSGLVLDPFLDPFWTDSYGVSWGFRVAGEQA